MFVDEIIKKGGVTHILFTSSLRRLARLIRESYLYLDVTHWGLIDVTKDITDTKHLPLSEPEGFPNSYI